MSILHAAELAAGILGAKVIEHQPVRDEVRDAWATTDKSARLLEYQDTTPMATGSGRCGSGLAKLQNDYQNGGVYVAGIRDPPEPSDFRRPS